MLHVVTDHLAEYTSAAKALTPRTLLNELEKYLSTSDQNVLALYGLRRTGKTTLLRQAAANHLAESAIIEVSALTAMHEVYAALDELYNKGIKYVFIDEITAIENFITCAAVLSDYYASFGMRIVLSGTDSLGFYYAKVSTLYDRVVLLHTTFISFREYSSLVGVKDIDIFLERGGTLNKSNIFDTEDDTRAYSDTAIANNIQNSLKNYDNGRRMWALRKLYLNQELTNYINRVVEDLDHEFAVQTILRTFHSYDIENTVNNFTNDPERMKSTVLASDFQDIVKVYANSLQIVGADELKTQPTDEIMSQLFEYLCYLDLVKLGKVFRCSDNGHVVESTFIMITQPGLRYSQATTLVSTLLSKLQNKASEEDIVAFTQSLCNDIKGRMLEDWVLTEVMFACDSSKYLAGRFEFEFGEFDMFIYDKLDNTCDIYEIKHADTFNSHALKNLLNRTKCELIESRFGKIKRKILLYRGENQIRKGVYCINVADFLKRLPDLTVENLSCEKTNFFGGHHE